MSENAVAGRMSPNNSSHMRLNPKLMTHRERMDHTANERVSRTVPVPITPVSPMALEVKRRQRGRETLATASPRPGYLNRYGGRDASVTAWTSSNASSRRPSFPGNSIWSARRTSFPSSTNLSGRGASAQRYEHVHSVVKDLIESKITPLEAQHGKPVQRQRSQSMGSGVTNHTVRLGFSYSGGHRITGPMTPRRGTPSAVRRAPRVEINAAGFLPSVPNELFVADGASTPDAFRTGRRRPTEWRTLERSPSRRLSQHAYVSQIVDNLENARVPYNHVPRCAQEIPERYKYHPPPMEHTDGEGSATGHNRPRWRQPSRSDIQRGRSIAAESDSSARGTRTSAGASPQQRTNSRPRGINRDSERNVSARSSLPSGSQAVDTRAVSRKRKVSIGSMSSLIVGRNEYANTVKDLEPKEIKPLLGLQRVLLFNFEPPKLLKSKASKCSS
ncbi:hypothetical protein DQ04_00381060 [Trypanosoma grayi]|uniref:hypothetical protein n=1 Tax=Trypanosoma grayi TaxID=71804 RepID=UPI0004F431CC|nr:hypothetical protein DQ04_00381060 [Trypanosoma grayi]KEG14601.1 hypothetical protein DQ04_00381060 [Trypanosoma grayi]